MSDNYSQVKGWGNLTLGDPPSGRGPIVGVPQDDLNALYARIRELKAELAALREARGAGSLDRELAYQNYINEPTPNGNTRMDNILGCIAPCPEKVERHVATQIDMAFQAGWRAALAALRALADAGEAG